MNTDSKKQNHHQGSAAIDTPQGRSVVLQTASSPRMIRSKNTAAHGLLCHDDSAVEKPRMAVTDGISKTDRDDDDDNNVALRDHRHCHRDLDAVDVLVQRIESLNPVGNGKNDSWFSSILLERQHHCCAKPITADQSNDVPLRVVVERLFEFLRVNSIATTTVSDSDDNDNHATNTETGMVELSCQTPLLLLFAIQIWNDADRNSIILHVQRRRGCGIGMQYVRRHLFAYVLDPTAATTGAKMDCPVEKLRSLRPLPSPSLQQQKLARDQQTATTTTTAEHQSTSDCNNSTCEIPSAAQICIKNLCCDSTRKDCNRLGLEALWNSAARMDDQRSFLNEDEELQEQLLHFISLDCDEHRVPINHHHHHHHTTCPVCPVEMQLLALQILVGVLPEQCENEDNKNNAGIMTDFWCRVLNACPFSAALARSRPLVAALFLQLCTKWLLLEPDRTRSLLLSRRSGFVSDLVEANVYGQKHHRLLEEASGDAIKILRETCS